MISLEAKNLGKRFGRRKVFEGIEFRLQNRGSLVVTGRNGSGKTTLLKTLCGLLRPTEGEVIISEEGRKLSPRESRGLLGLVMPDLELYGELTAFENLLFLSRMRGCLPEKDTIRERLAQMGLQEREDDLVSSFSSGMKQRLKYVFALLGRPEILFLDEPAANLDREGALLVDRIINIQKEKSLVVIATNEQSDLKYADQNIHLGQ
jgi:ABC-type multidrug transport system ATPase subunit